MLSKLFKNNSLNSEEFPILEQPLRRRLATDDKEFQFFISAEYNFETKTWKSWHLEIDEDQWMDSNTTFYRFPLLGFA